MIGIAVLLLVAIALLIGLWVYVIYAVNILNKKIRKLEWRVKHEQLRKT